MKKTNYWFSRHFFIYREFDVSKSLKQSISATQMKRVNIPFQSHNLILNFELQKDWVDICNFICNIWNLSIDPRSRSIDFCCCRVLLDRISLDQFCCVARSHAAWLIFLRLMNFDRSICLGRFFN